MLGVVYKNTPRATVITEMPKTRSNKKFEFRFSIYLVDPPTHIFDQKSKF